MATSLIGKVLDNYRIVENLGVGGMGVVYKAIHIKLDKVVALKMIAPGLAMNDKFIKRFQTEGKALAKLEDPNIVRIIDLRSDNDRWFIVMEYIDGVNLSDKIMMDGVFPWRKAIPILIQILSAMNHAHRAKVIHRDLKPQNIMITEEGVVKITDFGLAKDRTVVSNTMTITSGGTLYYMSPEHVKGFQYIDYRSDIYSIGMILYEMLTGIVPFTDINSDFDIREMIMRKDFDKPSKYKGDIPAELESIVMKAIAKNPEDRYKNIEDMLQAVLKLEVHEETKIPQTSKASQDMKIADETQVMPGAEQEKQETEITEQKTGSSKKKTMLAIFGTLTIIMIIVLFFYSDLFFPGTGEIEKVNISSVMSVLTIPEQAFVFVGEDSIGKTPLVGYSILPGEYILSIKNDGYRQIDTNIVIKQQANLSLTFSLQELNLVADEKPPETEMRAYSEKRQIETQKSITSFSDYSSIRITSSPSNVTVWLNNKKSGVTPLSLKNLKSGNYNIRLEKEGYKEYSTILNLDRNKTQLVNATLEQHTGKLSINSNQKDIQIFIDNNQRYYSSLPFVIDKLPIGTYKLKIVKPGFSEYFKEVVISADQITTIDASLIRLIGNLSILVKPWGTVFINGEKKVSSTDRKFSAELPQETYTIKIEHPTLGNWQKQVEIKAGDETNITVNFNQNFELNVNSIDENGNSVSGQIWVDGKNTGKQTPGVISLNTGIHDLYIEAQGYTTIAGNKKILVDENLNAPVIFTLRKK